eukprot:gene3225-5540_t
MCSSDKIKNSLQPCIITGSVTNRKRNRNLLLCKTSFDLPEKEELLGDYYFARELLKTSWKNFEIISDDLKKNKSILKLYAQKSGNNFDKYIDSAIFNNQKLLIELMKASPTIYHSFPKQIQDEDIYYYYFIKYSGLMQKRKYYFSSKYQDFHFFKEYSNVTSNKEIMIVLLKKLPHVVWKYLPKNLKSDFDVLTARCDVINLVIQRNLELSFIEKYLLKYPYTGFRILDKHWKMQDQLIEFAIELSPGNIYFVPGEKVTKNFILSMKKHKKEIQWYQKKFKDDFEVVCAMTGMYFELYVKQGIWKTEDINFSFSQ